MSLPKPSAVQQKRAHETSRGRRQGGEFNGQLVAVEHDDKAVVNVRDQLLHRTEAGEGSGVGAQGASNSS